MPERVGKNVTQEEMAEVLGVSREWYARLESGKLSRVSREFAISASDRLLLDDATRRRLFNCTLSAAELIDRGRVGLRAVRFAKKVLSASSTAEAVQHGVEEVQSMVRPDLTLAVGPEFSNAAGPLAATVNDTTCELFLESNVGIPPALVAIARDVPLPDALDVPVVRTVVEEAQATIEREFTRERYAEGVGELRARTGLHVPVYQGYISTAWREHYEPLQFEAEFARTIALILEELLD